MNPHTQSATGSDVRGVVGRIADGILSFFGNAAKGLVVLFKASEGTPLDAVGQKIAGFIVKLIVFLAVKARDGLRLFDVLLRAHPYYAIVVSHVIFMGPGPEILLVPIILVHALVLIILDILGFTIASIKHGFGTSGYQSIFYEGITEGGSLSSQLQSIASSARFGGGNLAFLAVRCIAGVIACYVLLLLILPV